MDSEQLRHLVEDILAQQQRQDYEKVPAVQEPLASNDLLNDAERRMIIQTMNAFQKQ